MCGIAGWVDFNRNLSEERTTIQTMGEKLVCRGPDEGGLWLSTHAGLAHRRLIVVDPQVGKQPMQRNTSQGIYTLTYNGELYNTDSLREELRTQGWYFQGHGDTEVLLTAYIAWGPSCVSRLNGIFAFCIWDDVHERLFLARDRLGVKPLFFTERDGGLLFGSELKALLAHPLVKARLNRQGLAEIFAMGPAHTPGCGVFEGIEELRPGECALFDRSGFKRWRYWSLQSEPFDGTPQDAIQQVRWLMQDTVERQLVADVPVCTMLSGGLDSSVVTAYAAAAYRRHHWPTLRTFAIDYKDNERYFQPNDFQSTPDAPYAQQVADFLGTIHRRIEIDTPELVAALYDALVARDLPGMTDVDASLLLFSRAIKQEATVAVSGEAADEVFGGYPWFRRQEDIEAQTFPWMRKGAQRFQLLNPALLEVIRPQEYQQSRYEQALGEVPHLEGESGLAARMREISYLSIFWWMPVLLDRMDRMSMATGLEVRVPYCDHRLVQYVFNLPWTIKTYGGQLKGILRKAVEDELPQEVVGRKKSPFPKTHHPAFVQACKQLMEEVLCDANAPLRLLLDEREVRRFLSQDLSTAALPWFGQLMTEPQWLAYLWQVNEWMKRYHVQMVV
ncbi:MAG: asparagine synthase (glutamine-hydrolyzing) [Firmicutes bacterium]|nr:asparagine synthase (glutamine-hydrolyzing) [Bacillota bacterium]